MSKRKENPAAEENLPPSKRQKTIDGSYVHLTEEMLRVMLIGTKTLNEYQNLTAAKLDEIKNNTIYNIDHQQFLEIIRNNNNVRKKILSCFLGALFFEDDKLVNILMHNFDKLNEDYKEKVKKYAELVANLRQTNSAIANYDAVTRHIWPTRKYRDITWDRFHSKKTASNQDFIYYEQRYIDNPDVLNNMFTLVANLSNESYHPEALLRYLEKMYPNITQKQFLKYFSVAEHTKSTPKKIKKIQEKVSDKLTPKLAFSDEFAFARYKELVFKKIFDDNLLLSLKQVLTLADTINNDLELREFISKYKPVIQAGKLESLPSYDFTSCMKYLRLIEDNNQFLNQDIVTEVIKAIIDKKDPSLEVTENKNTIIEFLSIRYNSLSAKNRAGLFLINQYDPLDIGDGNYVLQHGFSINLADESQADFSDWDITKSSHLSLIIKYLDQNIFTVKALIKYDNPLSIIFNADLSNYALNALWKMKTNQYELVLYAVLALKSINFNANDTNRIDILREILKKLDYNQIKNVAYLYFVLKGANGIKLLAENNILIDYDKFNQVFAILKNEANKIYLQSLSSYTPQEVKLCIEKGIINDIILNSLENLSIKDIADLLNYNCNDAVLHKLFAILTADKGNKLKQLYDHYNSLEKSKINIQSFFVFHDYINDNNFPEEVLKILELIIYSKKVEIYNDTLFDIYKRNVNARPKLADLAVKLFVHHECDLPSSPTNEFIDIILLNAQESGKTDYFSKIIYDIKSKFSKNKYLFKHIDYNDLITEAKSRFIAEQIVKYCNKLSFKIASGEISEEQALEEFKEKFSKLFTDEDFNKIIYSKNTHTVLLKHSTLYAGIKNLCENHPKELAASKKLPSPKVMSGDSEVWTKMICKNFESQFRAKIPESGIVSQIISMCEIER